MTEEEVRTIVKEEIRIAIRDWLSDIVDTFNESEPIVSRDSQTCYGIDCPALFYTTGRI